MRPRKLEITALGPFAEKVDVDFDDLGADGLFLIHGPTGAGKTSLLDGLSFALYGTVPGARANQPLRSQHADLDVDSRAVLSFDIGDAAYQVERSPRWERPKPDGSGAVNVPAKAVLRRIDPGREGVLATGVREVGLEVERLVGLTSSQFQQVILLPQGQFERFLRADSKEREIVLESLFDTIDFKAAAQWLDQRAISHRATAADLRRRVDTICDEARRRTEAVLTPAPASDDAEPETVDIAAVGRWTADLAAEVRAVTERAAAADGAERRTRTEVDSATAIVEKMERRAALLRDRRKFAEREPEIEAARRASARAEEADRLRPGIEDLDHRAEVVARDDLAVVADLGAARVALDALPVPLDGTPELDLSALPSHGDVEAVLGAARSRRTVLDGLVDVALRARKAEADRAEAAARVAAADDRVRSARAKAERSRAQQPAATAAMEEAQAASARCEGLLARAVEAEARADAAAELADLQPRREAAAKDHQALADAYRSAKDQHLAALQRYLDGIAAHLAGKLELDAACRVCGSHDHPDPARPADDAVTQEEVDRLDAAAGAAEEERDAAKDSLDLLDRRVGALAALVGGTSDPAEMRRSAVEAREEAAAAVDLAGELDARGSRVAEIVRAIEVADADATDAERQAAEGRSDLAVIDDRIAGARAALREHLPDGIELSHAIDSLDAVERSLQRIADHVGDRREAAAYLRAARERVDAELAASSFATLDEARAAIVEPEAREELLQQIAAHGKRVAELEALLAEPTLADLPDDALDLDALRVLHRSAATERDAVRERLALVTDAEAAVAGAGEELVGLSVELAEAEAAAALHHAVADRCNGRVAPKVPLQRWVLGTYLEEVCEHANRRLDTMTAGRYRLRVTRTPARANSPAGLDLRVHDANSNQERSVTTLSGGETFQASLALALGVADSVAAHSGGVRLDTLFIDEGFGTLDPDALELAMDELDGLRAGGRMVGIISHVGALRERILRGVEVTPGPNGSSVRVGDIAPV